MLGHQNSLSPLCKFTLRWFPCCQLPTLSTFQFVNSHFVNIEQMGINKVGSWQSGKIYILLLENTWWDGEQVSPAMWSVFDQDGNSQTERYGATGCDETAVNMPWHSKALNHPSITAGFNIASNTRRDWLLTDTLLVLHTATYVALYNNFHLYSV